MRNVLIASMATAALMAAACTQAHQAERNAATGAILGATTGDSVHQMNNLSEKQPRAVHQG